MTEFKNKEKAYNLEERAEKFGENVIDLCKSVSKNTITDSIVKQLVRSSTSVGANYMEANGASSKKDFINKIHICKKESQETKHWLRMLARATDENQTETIKILWSESLQLSMIFGKIAFSARESSKS